MLKNMLAKYPGRCAATGSAIRPGDDITYDTVSRKAYLFEPGDSPVIDEGRYISHVIRFGDKEYYRNKKGRCEDAPCCGCCTI